MNNHYHAHEPDSPKVPPEDLKRWKQELEDIKKLIRPFLTSTQALRKPQFALQGSNGVIRSQILESIQGTITFKDVITGQRNTIVCTDPVTILEPRPPSSAAEKEPPPPLILFSTGKEKISTYRQTVIEERCGDPDAKYDFFKVWSPRPLDQDIPTDPRTKKDEA